MSAKNTNQYTRISAEEIWKTQGETDWERVRAMTDEDIKAAITEDPDAIDTDEAFGEDAVTCPPFTFLDNG